MSRRSCNVLLLLALAAFVVLFAAPFIGMQPISPCAVLGGQADAVTREILWHVRVPRVLLAFLAGAGLAASGMVFQAMFRNPLATPYTLGVSSGASLGAALYLQLGLAFSLPGLPGVSLFAFVGAVGTIALVYGLSRVRGGFGTATLLLAGIAVSLFLSSLILFLQYLSDFTRSFRIIHWLMGGLEVMGYDAVWGVLPLVVVGSFLLFVLSHELNLLTVGDDIALSRGVNVNRVKKLLFGTTSLVVGGIVAHTGPIGFVGMMAPHICRLLVGANHRILLPATLLFGGAFLVFCDTLARTMIAPAEIPVGVITSLLGGPFFIWLLAFRR